MVNAKTPSNSLSNIWIAASDGEIEKVKYFIAEENTSVNAQDENGYTPLQASVSYDHFELATLLLQNGADPNLCDFDGESPLHHCETARCAQLLIEFGADPQKKNSEDITAYENAIEEENEELVAFLRPYAPEASSRQNDNSGSLAHVDYEGNPHYNQDRDEISLSRPFMSQFETIMNDQNIQNETERDGKLNDLVLNLVKDHIENRAPQNDDSAME